MLKTRVKMSDKNDYFDFVSNVLGVKSILLSQSTENVLQVVPLLIAVENLNSYTDAENELLSKMIGALKIDQKLIRLVDLKEVSLYQPEFSIHFVEELNQNNVSLANQVMTYAPRSLLKHPEFKKQAWDEMQKAIVYFSNTKT